MKKRSEIRSERMAERKKKFLEAFQENSGGIYLSCAAAGVTTQTARDWYDKDPAFHASWDSIEQSITENMERECIRRATEGHSDLLMIFWLKAHKPDYYNRPNRVALTDPSGNNAYNAISDNELKVLAESIITPPQPLKSNDNVQQLPLEKSA